MKAIVAVLLGFLSGFLIYMIVALMVSTPGSKGGPSVALVVITFIGGWALSTWLLLRGTKTVSRVFTRGSLLGASEWLLFGLAGVIMSGRAAAQAAGSTPTGGEAAGAVIGGGIGAILSGGIAIVMAVVCLIVFTIAYFTGREMRDTTGTPTRKCPECAEMVQAEARKCKHCGALLVSDTAPAP